MPTFLRTLWLAATALVLGACATTGEESDAQRRRNLVLVPADAQAVDSVSWSRVRDIEPLNQRMILMHAERPYLLVLAQSCRGLQRNSVVVTDNIGNTFQPRVDSLRFVDPFDSALNQGLDPLALDRIGAVSPTRAGFAQNATICRPDTLYAIQEEDIADIKQSVSRKRRKG